MPGPRPRPLTGSRRTGALETPRRERRHRPGQAPGRCRGAPRGSDPARLWPTPGFPRRPASLVFAPGPCPRRRRRAGTMTHIRSWPRIPRCRSAATSGEPSTGRARPGSRLRGPPARVLQDAAPGGSGVPRPPILKRAAAPAARCDQRAGAARSRPGPPSGRRDDRDPQGVGDDGQRRVHGADRREEAGIGHVEVVQLVRLQFGSSTDVFGSSPNRRVPAWWAVPPIGTFLPR